MSAKITLDPAIEFPAELPITAALDELATAIAQHQVIIVAGETGSGKTTQLPKLCLAMGRGDGRQIACTQPRRIAATSVAARVAQELNSQVGELVGYKIRFSDKVKSTSRIKFLTDGMLLAEIQGDARLRAYDTIIIDEAHERSLNIDFLLGFVKRLLPQRPDLRVIISSATLEIERFAKFFDGAPVVSVSGRTFPVDVIYRPPSDAEVDLADAVANTVNEITEIDPRGDILVFLPGEREIKEAMGELESRALPHTTLLPLFARLTAAEQQRVFQRERGRRVILATNVADTSLTIPGIVYVVDAGVARINRYDVRTGVSQLLVEPVSRASADQRKGRCGRVQSGVCFRLYEQQDYETRPHYTDPEIKRTSLAGVILRMKSLGLGMIEDFPFLDPPHARAITEGYRVLEELGAIEENGTLTEIGYQLGRLPLDPRLGRMILGGREEGAISEIVIIAAALGLRDPRDRPQAEAGKADEAHKKFREEGSDFVAYLKMWAFYQDARKRVSRRQLQRLCRDNFLNFNRMREWDDIHEQIVRVLQDFGFKPNTQHANTEQIHRALLPGLLSKIGMWSQEQRIFVGARQTKFYVHPSSSLAKKPPPWMMAAELVETSQLFARTCARLDPAWVENIAGSMVRRSHSDPHWEQKQAQVMAREQVTLYGLPIVKNRTVPYAKFDPVVARDLFITHALVRGEFTTKAPFMAHNQRLQDESQRMRDKARRSDMFADESALFEFFDKRLPPEVNSGQTFEKWRLTTEARQPQLLYLSMDDLLLGEDSDLTKARFPDELVVDGARVPLTYKFDPGEDDDGITVNVPLAVLPQLDPDVMDWTILGWHRAKIYALLDNLPKATRKAIALPGESGGGLDTRAEQLAAKLTPFAGPMVPVLERALYELTGERTGRDAWDLRAVPHYLHFTYRVLGDGDKVLAESRDLADLQLTWGARAKELWATARREKIERTGLRAWDFDTLPASVTVDVGGRRVQAYPALVDAEHHVDVKLLESQAAAAAATRDGLRRLYLFALSTSYSKLEVQLPASFAKDQRKLIITRALDDALGLDDELPRDKAAFTARVAHGSRALPDTLGELVRTVQTIVERMAKIGALTKPLIGKPGVVKAFVDDVSSQLSALLPADLMKTTSLARQRHILRYLDAIVVRLQRYGVDPAKDAQKAQPLAPLWQQFLARRSTLYGRVPVETDELRWLFEELRVATFAPELKPAVPVSLQKVQDRWAELSRR
ncbi:ATP-dependent RNA helicase HrpA [soil metagenome]